MSFLDRLLGRQPLRPGSTSRSSRRPPPIDRDAAAVERYRYLLRTAPPQDRERAHEEAFEQLTPRQRAMVRQDLEARVPESDRARSDDPADLARAATRAEMRNPGTLERAFGGGQAPGMGASFLQTFAAVFVATSMAQMLFGTWGDPMTDPGMAEGDAAAEGTDGMEADGSMASDEGGWGDFGGDFGDLGGFDI